MCVKKTREESGTQSGVIPLFLPVTVWKTRKTSFWLELHMMKDDVGQKHKRQLFLRSRKKVKCLGVLNKMTVQEACLIMMTGERDLLPSTFLIPSSVHHCRLWRKRSRRALLSNALQRDLPSSLSWKKALSSQPAGWSLFH